MAKTNLKRKPVKTHEGAVAQHVNSELSLRRSLMACMLWEDEFYEDGVSIAERIADLVPFVAPTKVAAMAIEAREKMKLRHAPLWVVRAMAKLPEYRGLVADTLSTVIQRPDELTEFLSLYWKDKKQPVSAQVKKGLAAAFTKFSEYQLAKYNRDGAVKLKDVLFICHAKPNGEEQEAVWKRLIDGTLATPDTWEVGLSAAKSAEEKKEVWDRLLAEKRLGALALLRNLRNMKLAGVSTKTVKAAIKEMKTERVLPFRFIAAARHAVNLEPELEVAMLKCLEEHEKLPGKTVLLVDVSGSMDAQISRKSDLTRMDAACGLAMLAREICEEVVVYTFSSKTVEVPPRRGFALRDAIVGSQAHSSTYLGAAVSKANTLKHDRLIVFTDEQSHDTVPAPGAKGYMVNVASNTYGVGYGAWSHIDGFSEAIIDYILTLERSE